MSVWIRPWMRVPTSVPTMKPTPPVMRVAADDDGGDGVKFHADEGRRVAAGLW